MKITRIIDMHYSLFVFYVDKKDEVEIKRIEDFFSSKCRNKAGIPIILWLEE